MQEKKSSLTLKDACRLIFGQSFHFCNETINYIQESGLKSAYRQQAKLYHPDRAIVSDFSESELIARFKEITLAYNMLLDRINGKHITKNPSSNDHTYTYKRKSTHSGKSSYKYSAKNRRKTSSYSKQDFFYSGKIPRRKLKFGEFLFYNKIISWNSLISAITWQYQIRPKVGQLCIKENLLTEDDIKKILHIASPEERFGAAAVKHGFLKHNDLKTILRMQAQLNKPLGRYFTINNLISPDELARLLISHKQHNNRF